MPFTPATFRFFKALARNNNKPWFEAHRAEYAETDVRGLWRRIARTAPRAERR